VITVICRVHEAHAYVKLEKNTARAFIRPGEKDCRLLVNGSPISEEVRSNFLPSYKATVLEIHEQDVSINRGCPESIAKLPPFPPIEGHKWFVQISSQ
jgi:hypothetical protein